MKKTTAAKKRGRGRPKGSKNKVKKNTEGVVAVRRPSVSQLVDYVMRSHDKMSLNKAEFGAGLVKALTENYRIVEADQDGNFKCRSKTLGRAQIIEYLTSQIDLDPADEDWTVWFDLKDHFFNIHRPDLPDQEHSDPALVAVWAYEKGYIDLALKTGRPHIEGQPGWSCCTFLEKHCLKGDPEKCPFAERRVIDPIAVPRKYEWRINAVQQYERWSQIAERIQS